MLLCIAFHRFLEKSRHWRIQENQPLFYVRILHRHVFDKCDYAKAIDDRKFFDVYRYLHRIQK